MDQEVPSISQCWYYTTLLGQLRTEGSAHFSGTGSLDDQTQVDSKLAGQPEHASLNQCQPIAAN